MTRFEYTKYDNEAVDLQTKFKALVEELDININCIGAAKGDAPMRRNCARAKALAITKLEETFMWIGKAIRDDQIERNGL
jgi:hypothetical protein